MKKPLNTRYLLLIAMMLLPAALMAQKRDSLMFGVASYYHNKFNGRKTSNGEIFRNDSLTAAHKYLPFGTRVRVTNLNNDSSVIVRINDRLPQSSKRSIDLSQAAARRLDMMRAGIVKARIEILPADRIIVPDTTQVEIIVKHLNSARYKSLAWSGKIPAAFTKAGAKEPMVMEISGGLVTHAMPEFRDSLSIDDLRADTWVPGAFGAQYALPMKADWEPWIVEKSSSERMKVYELLANTYPEAQFFVPSMSIHFIDIDKDKKDDCFVYHATDGTGPLTRIFTYTNDKLEELYLNYYVENVTASPEGLTVTSRWGGGMQDHDGFNIYSLVKKNGKVSLDQIVCFAGCPRVNNDSEFNISKPFTLKAAHTFSEKNYCSASFNAGAKGYALSEKDGSLYVMMLSAPAVSELFSKYIKESSTAPAYFVGWIKKDLVQF